MYSFELYNAYSMAIFLLDLCIIFYSLWRDSTLLLKPSFQVSFFFCFQVQFGSLVLTEEVWDLLQDPTDFFLFSQVFPLSLLIGSLFIFRRTSHDLYSRIMKNPAKQWHSFAFSTFLFAIAVGIVGLYLCVVPPTETGLYALLSGASDADLVREDTFKLLDDPLVRYLFSMMEKSVAPLAMISFCLLLLNSIRKLNPFTIMYSIGAISFLLVAVCLYGARGPAAMLVLGALFIFYIKRGLPFKLGYLFAGTIAVVCILSLPTLMTFFQQDIEPNFENIHTVFQDVMDRAFLRGVEPGIWTMDYAQRVGHFGISGLGNIAQLFGEPMENVPNIVGLAYTDGRLKSISATVVFNLNLYACFGIAAFFPSLILVWALDFILYFYNFLDDITLLPCIGACLIPMAVLSFASYTTIFFTHGLVFSIGICLIYSYFSRTFRIAHL